MPSRPKRQSEKIPGTDLTFGDLQRLRGRALSRQFDIIERAVTIPGDLKKKLREICPQRGIRVFVFQGIHVFLSQYFCAKIDFDTRPRFPKSVKARDRAAAIEFNKFGRGLHEVLESIEIGLAKKVRDGIWALPQEKKSDLLSDLANSFVKDVLWKPPIGAYFATEAEQNEAEKVATKFRERNEEYLAQVESRAKQKQAKTGRLTSVAERLLVANLSRLFLDAGVINLGKKGWGKERTELILMSLRAINLNLADRTIAEYAKPNAVEKVDRYIGEYLYGTGAQGPSAISRRAKKRTHAGRVVLRDK